MFVRALTVVLAMLNLGVAVWWLARPAEPSPAAVDVATPAGVATLQLVEAGEAETETLVAAPPPPAALEPTVVASPPSPPIASASVAPLRCLSLGPFATRAQANNALARIRSRLERAALREQHDEMGDGYRVMIPAVSDRVTAQQISRRIVEAGLDDYYVLPADGGYAIALGKYRNRDGAERRLSELRSKGFAARLIVDGAASRWWIDARSRVPTASLLAAAGAPRQRSLDCAALR